MNDRTQTVIRDARLADADILVHLLEIMHFDANKREANRAEVDLLRAILAQPLRRILVAEYEGAVVGTVDVLVVKNLSRGCSPWATVENLVVHPEFRRHGIGRALMGEAEDFARQHACYKIQLVSNEARGPAHALYENLGYRAKVEGFRKYLEEVEHV